LNTRSVALCVALLSGWYAAGSICGQQSTPSERPPINPGLMERVRSSIPPPQQSLALYGTDPVPNSKSAPNEEANGRMGSLIKVSRPTLEVFLPAKAKANGASIIIFPGGGYVGLTWIQEGPAVAQFFQDHGVAAFVVKYRLPSDATMEDKSIGPLEDAQEAMIVVRKRAHEWNLDPDRVGIIGFSAGGHLASTLATHFEKAYVPNPDHIKLRPDFMILIYPVISMDAKITNMTTRTALLGATPSDEQVRPFSNELHVTNQTPPTLLLQAADDMVVDVDNSILFFEALRHADVPVEMTIFDKGEHGFILIPRDRWQSIVAHWMERYGWMNQ